MRISLIFSNLVVIKQYISNYRMHNLFANFVKMLDVCKNFSVNLVNELGNMPRPDVVPKFSDLEVIALNLTAESRSSSSTPNQSRCASSQEASATAPLFQTTITTLNNIKQH